MDGSREKVPKSGARSGCHRMNFLSRMDGQPRVQHALAASLGRQAAWGGLRRFAGSFDYHAQSSVTNIAFARRRRTCHPTAMLIASRETHSAHARDAPHTPTTASQDPCRELAAECRAACALIPRTAHTAPEWSVLVRHTTRAHTTATSTSQPADPCPPVHIGHAHPSLPN